MKSFILLAAVSLPAVLTSAAPGLAADQTIARKLYVANTAGDTLSVVDLDREEVVREFSIGKHPHGLALSPDQRRIYCSLESARAVKFMDTSTDQIVASVATTGVPNQLATTPDSDWVYVAINDKGTADVIDVRQAKVAKTLDIGSRPHLHEHARPGTAPGGSRTLGEQLYWEWPDDLRHHGRGAKVCDHRVCRRCAELDDL